MFLCWAPNIYSDCTRPQTLTSRWWTVGCTCVQGRIDMYWLYLYNGQLEIAESFLTLGFFFWRIVHFSVSFASHTDKDLLLHVSPKKCDFRGHWCNQISAFKVLMTNPLVFFLHSEVFFQGTLLLAQSLQLARGQLILGTQVTFTTGLVACWTAGQNSDHQHSFCGKACLPH